MTEAVLPIEQAWIEEAKRRRALNEPGIPAEKFRVFQKLLSQKIRETGSLEREYCDELLLKLKRGEL